ALDGARDHDQIEAILKALDMLGRSVNLAQHLGFIMDWHLIGPFDNTEHNGFETAYPPESSIELGARHAGLEGAVGWARFVTQDVYGVVDLNQALGTRSGAACYAFADFSSAADRTVELRLGSSNACKIWVNGALVFARALYHHDMQPLQLPSKTVLRPV